VFGAWLPFWSNNLTGYGNFPRAVRGQDYTLRMVFDASALSFAYYVNGMQAGPFMLDPQSVNFLMTQGGQALGVYAAATPHVPGNTASTVFTNISCSSRPTRPGGAHYGHAPRRGRSRSPLRRLRDRPCGR
jgi:hypothetical protein